MKFSAAVLSALYATVLAAPAPASNPVKPGELVRKARVNRQNHFAQKAKARSYGGDSSSSGWGQQQGGDASPTSGSDGAQPSGGYGFGSSSGTWGSSGARPSGGYSSGSSSGSPGSGSSSGSYGSGSSSGSYGSSGAQPSGSPSSGSSSGTYSASGAQASGSYNSVYNSAYTSSSSSTDSTSTSSSSTSTTSSDDEYNESWAGVVVQTDEGSITGVSATFTLPDISLPTDGAQVDATTHTASTWIGIDGYSCGTGLWQAGVDGNIDSSGSVSWYAWYEWYPANTVSIDLGDLAAGDVIFVNVTASSTTAGTVYMENQSAGKSFTKDVTSSDELCLADAEWIEEDLVVDGSDEGFANFGTITFKDAVATTKTGTLTPGNDPIVMDVEDSDGNALTSTSTTDSSVIVKYV